jgi:hypothetical protein
MVGFGFFLVNFFVDRTAQFFGQPNKADYKVEQDYTY